LLCAAESLGLPLVKAYLGNKNGDGGANFAVSGATALEPSFFEERGFSVPTNYSLTLQLNWFKELLPSLCNSSTGKFSISFPRSVLSLSLYTTTVATFFIFFVLLVRSTHRKHLGPSHHVFNKTTKSVFFLYFFLCDLI